MASESHKAVNTTEIDRLALALAKEPGSKAFIPLAEEYGKAGMWEEAAAVLEDGLKTYPSFITAMVALGRAYDQMNQPVKAKAILEEAVKLSPENLRAHRTLAKIYAAQGAKEAALRSCNVILSVNPQDQEAISLCTMLGTPVAQPSTEPAKPSPAKQSSKPTPESSASPAEEGRSRPVGRDMQQQSAAPAESQAEDSTASTAAAESTSHERKHAIQAQLTQWLAAIQTRRRDRDHPSKSRAETS
jgi:tetratricopeptide (TPR) repeat protein